MPMKTDGKLLTDVKPGPRVFYATDLPGQNLTRATFELKPLQPTHDPVYLKVWAPSRAPGKRPKSGS